MLGIGALYYRLKRTLRGGFTAAWFREVVRPKILQTPSLLLPTEGTYEIHVLTSADDWLNLFWTLKTWFAKSGELAPLCIHDDGTVPDDVREQFLAHFVGARWISRKEADEEVLPTLREFPQCREFRETNNLSLKVFDLLHYAVADRILLLDSDLLFYSRPDELIESLEAVETTNRYNRDIADAYTAEREALERAFSMSVETRFNSGLCVFNRDSIRLDWLEEFLSRKELAGHFWRIEQTLFCLCSSRHGAEPLPPTYDVVLDRGIDGKPVKHYVGVIREMMFAEGVRALVRNGFLESLATTLPTMTVEEAVS